jgi:hypothetical protein
MERKAMDEDGVIALVVFGAVSMCIVSVVIGAWVCPQTRPRRISGYEEEDLV